MKYVLMFMLYNIVGSAGYGGPATAEFNSKEACEDARVALQREFSRAYFGSVCVPKGTTPLT